MTETRDAKRDSETLREVADLIRDDPNRKGALLEFGSAGQLVMTGDMHGSVRNFEKLQRYCALDRNPGRSVILHELIHTELDFMKRQDDSIQLLVRAAEWKRDHPDNVFFLQSNHELAQWKRQEITKAGRSVLDDFEYGVRAAYGAGADDVMSAVDAYIAALPFAARTRNGVFMSHSLPDPMMFDMFDMSLFERQPSEAELSPGGLAYSLVWGRFHSAEAIEYLARKLDVEVFIVGHTPQEFGHARFGRLIVLASDHAHGVFLPIDLAVTPEPEKLERAIRKFVSIE